MNPAYTCEYHIAACGEPSAYLVLLLLVVLVVVLVVAVVVVAVAVEVVK